MWIKLCGPRMFVILRIELTKQVSTKNKNNLFQSAPNISSKPYQENEVHMAAMAGSNWSYWRCIALMRLSHTFQSILLHPAPSWFGSTPMVWSARFAHQFPWHLTWLGSMWVRAWVTTCSSGNAGWASSSGNFCLGMVRDCLRIWCLR